MWIIALFLAGCTDYDLNPIPKDPVPDVDTAFPAPDVPGLQAVCGVEPQEVLAIHESAKWVGSDSVADAGISGYQWTLLSVPPGSMVPMPAGDADRPGFTPDIAGEYVAALTITDSTGVTSEPCVATLTASPGQGLWIEIFWEHRGDDMDLHLVRGGSWLESDGDCYYSNCVGALLDWGTPGYTGDNPRLDLDDVPGTGPENINIDDPAPGNYSVYVHDYPGSSYWGENNVTMNVYLAGNLEWSETRDVDSEGCYERFVDVAVPSGAITAGPVTCN